jgi:hypothetical protein
VRGNGIRQTHNGTGGTGTLTLVAVSGWPAFSNVFTGVRFVDYEIDQYTDASKTVLAQQECGEGSIDTSTGILTRTKIDSTWNGTTYLPNPGSATAPTALNITNTAANVDIICSPSAASMMAITPFFYGTVANVADGLGCLPMNLAAAANSTAAMPTSGTVQYAPVYIGHRGPFSQASVYVTTGSTGGTPTLGVALFEVASDGSPGKKLIDFGNLGSTSNTAPFFLTNTALATPVYLSPGWYYQGMLWIAGGATLGSLAVRGANAAFGGGPGGTLFASTSPFNNSFRVGSQTVFTDPATAPTSVNSQINIPAIAYK